jgi:hypothetical protein
MGLQRIPRRNTVLVVLALAGVLWAGAPPAVTPKEFHRGASSYALPSVLEVKMTPGAQQSIALLAERLEGTDISLRVTPLKESGMEVVLAGDVDYKPKKIEVPPHPEGYLIDVSPAGVVLLARDARGLRWGLVRLREALDRKRKAIAELKVRDWADLPWRGVHLRMISEAQFPAFKRFVDEVLLPYHFNTVVLEVNYGFAFERHPEVSEPDSPGAAFVEEDLRPFLEGRGLRLIPQFNCLGHQSWKQRPGALLRAYPHFDETPKIPADDRRLYCRSWCPRHPELTPILFELWEELLAAFAPGHVHLGMDEVFLIAEKECPRCSGSTPGEIFLAAVTQYHAFFRGAKTEVLMWGDRLLEKKRFGYSRYEASETDTWKALAFLPRDIIMCDWHYGVEKEYPSVKYFLEEGFRVLACPWRDPRNVRNLWEYTQKVRTDRFLGFLATTWVGFDDLCEALFEDKGSDKARGAAACLKLVGQLCWQGQLSKPQ